MLSRVLARLISGIMADCASKCIHPATIPLKRVTISWEELKEYSLFCFISMSAFFEVAVSGEDCPKGEDGGVEHQPGLLLPSLAPPCKLAKDSWKRYASLLLLLLGHRLCSRVHYWLLI